MKIQQKEFINALAMCSYYEINLMIILKENIPEPDDRNEWNLQSGDDYNKCYVLIGFRSNA